MKTGPLLSGLLLAAATTHNRQTEAAIPPKGMIPFLRGALAGTTTTAVKPVIKKMGDTLTPEAAEVIEIEGGNLSNSTKKTVLNRAIESATSFPVDFAANAIGTAVTDKVFKTSLDTPENIKGLLVPMISMRVAKEALEDKDIPELAKQTAAYGAFWAGRLAQQKAPISSGLAVLGYASAAAITKHAMDPSERAKMIRKASNAAVSGFLAPESDKLPNKASKQSREAYLRKRYGVEEGTKMWEDLDGSICIELKESKEDTEEKKGKWQQKIEADRDTRANAKSPFQGL